MTKLITYPDNIDLSDFKKDIEKDIGADELKKDVFNELRMEELENNKDSKDD